MSENILTCVYCGMAYPEGTPPHGAKVLTDHIRACEKHPMRALEEVSAAQDEYLKLLSDEIDSIIGAGYVHGWRSGRYEQGVILRKKIAEAKKRAGLPFEVAHLEGLEET